MAKATPDKSTTKDEMSPFEAAILELLKQNSDSAKLQADILESLRPKVDAITPEYLAKNPIPKLKNPAFQNAYPVNPNGLSDSTINKLHELKPGRYLGGVVTVLVEESPMGDSSEKKTFLLYKNKTPDQRMALAAHFTSFADLIDKIAAEQGAQSAPSSSK
jgi:hypothetical protein